MEYIVDGQCGADVEIHIKPGHIDAFCKDTDMGMTGESVSPDQVVKWLCEDCAYIQPLHED